MKAGHVLFVATVTLLVSACDTIRVNGANGRVGVLVDGVDSNNDVVVNDRRRTGNGVASINVGRLSPAIAPSRNEAIAFGYNRSPVRNAMAWTDERDEFSLSLNNQLSLPMTVWIVQGPFDEQRQHAIDACIETAAVWEDENLGVRFSEFAIKDATGDPDITSAILDSTGGDNRNWDDLADEIGFDNGRINVYWLNTVDGSTTTGWSDFGSRIVMGKNTGDELLAHEIGHAFSLRHPAACGASDTNFDQTNVMWQCSSSREFLTEGQVFRCHFNSNSTVNALYNARPAQPTVSCGSATQTAECPALGSRLWADGSFPSS